MILLKEFLFIKYLKKTYESYNVESLFLCLISSSALVDTFDTESYIKYIIK